jgi:molybdenum cofactor synthesis domain-containing protein
MYRVGILTISDRGARGEREDRSGPTVADAVSLLPGVQIVARDVVPDERAAIEAVLRRWVAEGLDLILTTGGTGLSPRDVTPEATRAVIDREAPGFAEAMRAASLAVTPHAMLSRAVSGLVGCTLIVNLPGSPKAARENLLTIMPALQHGLDKLRGDPAECASPE